MKPIRSLSVLAILLLSLIAPATTSAAATAPGPLSDLTRADVSCTYSSILSRWGVTFQAFGLTRSAPANTKIIVERTLYFNGDEVFYESQEITTTRTGSWTDDDKTSYRGAGRYEQFIWVSRKSNNAFIDSGYDQAYCGLTVPLRR